MNHKMIRFILAKMLGVEALLLLLPALTGVIYGEFKEACAFLIPAAVLLLIFVFFGRRKPEAPSIYGKDGLIIVASAWGLWSELCGCTVRDGIRIYNDRFLYFKRCGGTSPVYAVLEEFLPLGRRYGSACICHDADNTG